ncbi:hypothetical protein AMEX_G2708 [Astyanax mexicanus]|uniref:Uncharacterized protein n=1 Tax=Astyanax mexicanus TaxID=7994 RepID=A0A8T2MHX4_ASTMX|nr:hypothetical protein AMEX_G2708 [Astyanax mexicanus]
MDKPISGLEHRYENGWVLLFLMFFRTLGRTTLPEQSRNYREKLHKGYKSSFSSSLFLIMKALQMVCVWS